MADHFLPGLESFKQSFSLSDNPEFINHFSGINPSHLQRASSALNIHNLMGLDNLVPHLPESPQNLPGLFVPESNSLVPPPVTDHNENDPVGKKRRAMELHSPANSSPQASDNGNGGRKKSSGRGKKAKGNQEDKPREVVHVRAKRGQATDSHSLAERVRREKINERLRCLQDIVPGCYKTMGMAVMLDEIINYVQSLQNQVEFLSMKLTAASTFYDFNSETDALETIQRAKAFEALKIQNGAIQGLTSAQFAPLDLNFGFYQPQLPHNR